MWYDAFAVLLIGLFAWRGAARGAVWQLAVIGAIVLCAVFAGQLTPALEPHIPLEEPFHHWAAVGIVYLALSLVTFLAARQLRAWLEKVKFVEYDRHWGAILGLVKGGGLMLALTCLLVILMPQSRAPIRESWTGDATQVVVDRVAHLLPKRVVSELQQAFKDESLLPGPTFPIRGSEPFELTL
jgi:uncharacterized membrane protein required for colicin V production